MVVVHSTEQLSFKSEKARKAHEARYRNYRSAANIWRQLSPEDRAYTLGKAQYDGDIEKAAHDDTLGSIKASGAKRDRIISTIRFTHKGDERFRVRYKTAQATRPPDVRVRKHEKRLRERGLRRPVRAREGTRVALTTSR